MKYLKLEKINAKLAALFLLQYTLLIPIMSFIDSTFLTAIFGLAIIIIMLIHNFKYPVNISALGVFFAILTILLIKAFQSSLTLVVVFYYIAIAGPPLLMFMYPFDYETFLKECIKWAKIGFFLICWVPFSGSYNYMRFGYGMLPIVIFVYIDLFYKKSGNGSTQGKKGIILFESVVLLLGLFEMIIYGARGAVFSFLLFFVLERFLINKRNIIKNFLIAFVGSVSYIFIVPILNCFEVLTKEIGIYSYSITKFKMMIASGFAVASSGRDELYLESIEMIKRHPLVGNVIAIKSSGDYSHNLFLQVAKDLGILGLVVLCVFLAYVIYKMCHNKIKTGEKLIYVILFSMAIGRLMFSSTLWMRPEFWMLIFFTTVNTKRIRR